jgi:exodeoxyribonuclease VII large subunit
MTALFQLPFDEPKRGGRAPEHRVLSVTELTAAIRLELESTFPEVLVEGEISNSRLWKTGHFYFTLKDATGQLKAVMFRSSLSYIRFTPEDGQHVVARGRVSVYAPKGEYQLVCEHLEPHGLGALQLAFDQLRQRLKAEGLFDAARKRALPALPRKIGVVTSLDGAAIKDIIHILHRRYPNVHLVISPARVQGDGAGIEIVRSLRQLGRVAGIDVIIVGRGGGSIEDLWAFNEERVARAIAASPVPVISAVGHETDYTISDFVADLRVPTPSAAAEVVVARKDEMANRITRAEARLQSALRDLVQRCRAKVHALERRPGLAGWPARLVLRGRHAADFSHRLARSARATVGRQERRTYGLRLRLEALDLGRRLGDVRIRVLAAREHLVHAAHEVRRGRDGRLRAIAGRLENLSPLAVLSRGYAVCSTADHATIVHDASTVRPGQGVRVTLHRGELMCEVKTTA